MAALRGENDVLETRKRGSPEPSYASGAWADGKLNVTVGGVDGQDISAMSGEWRHAFSLSEPANVVVMYRYAMDAANTLEGSESAYAYLKVDGVRLRPRRHRPHRHHHRGPDRRELDLYL